MPPAKHKVYAVQQKTEAEPDPTTDIWGPFEELAQAEQCVIALAGRPDISVAWIDDGSPD